jgi:multicopper oxidase
MSGTPLSRRHFLGLAAGAGATAALTSCTSVRPRQAAVPVTVPTGRVEREITLRATQSEIDLGGRTVNAWTYGQGLPGRPIRATAGDRLRITLRNELPDETSVHWHGLAVPNAMDGVPGVTTPAVQPGESFTYDFNVPVPGTHWFHPHTGLQLDTGLYAAFIVDHPRESGGYDKEWVVILDDWTQGVGRDPQQIFDELVAAGGQGDGGMMHGGMGRRGMGMDGGDVAYPMFLINGRPPADAETLRVSPKDRVRLRIINAGADTIFTVTVAGHLMLVTHSDGYPVRPVRAQSLRVGMGERYDVLVDVGDGVFPVVAEPAGKGGHALAVLRSAPGTLPPVPAPGAGRSYPITADMLQSDPAVALPGAAPQATHDLLLSGSMAPYVWTINGATYDRATPLTVEVGQAVRLRLANMSMMSHPVHLHGHTFQIGPAGAAGARKDTVLLPPMARAEVDLVADNPGAWMLHCHNAYHAEAGMMTRLDYTT